MIYNVDYRFVQEVSDIVYKNILINFEQFKKDLKSVTYEENSNGQP